jgi:aminoglycoside phosphotransferase family enzyme/predicted kinase
VIPEGQREAASLLAALTGAAPIETHISAVFVGRDDAFKLKKAVTLPFLDFAPLAARERFARRELALNQPNAPGIYRAVLPITREADGSLALAGAGAPVEWVLRMAPIPPGDFLDALAARGAVDDALLDAVADAAFALLDAAPRIEGVDSAADMAAVLEGNIAGCLAAGLDPARVGAIGAAMREGLAAIAPLLAARAEAGFVRRCHGDLHLGNLCLWEGRPVAFDALEFDEALAITDIGYDLAFLLMDLETRLGHGAANRAMNRVLARNGDVGMLGALPFWLAQRALVRAKVEPGRGRDGAAYLAVAERCLRPVPPRLVAVGGLPGTGKTRLARAIAPDLGAPPGALLLRTDEIRKRRAGVAPETRLPAAAYGREESAAVHAAMFALARQALATGRSVVLDATFLDPAMRDAAAAAAGGAPFAGFWLEAPIGLLRARVAARRGDASDADVAVLEAAARADPGPIRWQRLDAGGDPGQAARTVLGLT